VKKTVSKFAFQVHNLQRYNEEAAVVGVTARLTLEELAMADDDEVGLCTLNQVDP
jgi:hypothetical protein